MIKRPKPLQMTETISAPPAVFIIARNRGIMRENTLNKRRIWLAKIAFIFTTLFIGHVSAHAQTASQIQIDQMASGSEALERHDYATALRLFSDLSEQGFPQAQYNLALMYRDGLGVNQSDIEAARLYSLAASKNLPEAQYNLASAYNTGTGVQ